MGRQRFRYQETKPNKRRKGKPIDLEEIPVEDVSEEEKKPPRFKMPKALRRTLLILAVCAVFLLVWVNRENLAPDRVVSWVEDQFLGMSVGEGYPTGIVGSQVLDGNVQMMDDDLAVLSDTSLVVLNDTAKELINRQHSFGLPAMKVGGTNVLVYNLGGKGIQLESKAKSLYKATLSENVLTGAIAPNGVYAVVTESQGYMSALSVYSAQYSTKMEDDLLYQYYFSEYYITDVALSSDGKTAAAVGIASNAGAIQSALYLFHFDKEEPSVFLEFTDNLLIDVEFLNNGNLAVVGNNGMAVVTAGGDKKEVQFDRKTLATFCINPSGGVVLALSNTEDGRDCELILVDESGAEKSRAQTNSKIISVDYRGNIIAALHDGIIDVYTLDGKMKGSENAGNDAKVVKLASEQKAYVLGISEIRLVSL